jgi:hypothetical protein
MIVRDLPTYKGQEVGDQNVWLLLQPLNVWEERLSHALPSIRKACGGHVSCRLGVTLLGVKGVFKALLTLLCGLRLRPQVHKLQASLLHPLLGITTAGHCHSVALLLQARSRR